jgi:hypothetical protein
MDSHEVRRAAEILIGPNGHGSDIWRAAHPLIVQHGREASLIAIKRANDLATNGDVIEALDWVRIFFAIEYWETTQRPDRHNVMS